MALISLTFQSAFLCNLSDTVACNTVATSHATVS
jgi:hypothetical protein